MPKPFYRKTLSEREKTIQRANEVRAKMGKDSGIFLGKHRLVTKDVARTIYERWRKRKGERVVSHTKVSKNSRAQEVAKRLIAKNILVQLNHFRLTDSERNIIEKLVMRKQNEITAEVNGKKYDLIIGEPTDVLILSLINRLGNKKTEQIIERILERSNEILDGAKNGPRESTDIFHNANVNIHTIKNHFDLLTLSNETMVEDISKEINRMKNEEHILNESGHPNKKMLVEKIRRVNNLAEKELYAFKVTHNLA
jgi:hypothetical protein